MPIPVKTKQERIVEAVRRGLEGDAAVEFLREAGFAVTSAGIARQLRLMGGRGRVQELVTQGKSNIGILTLCLPHDDFSELQHRPPTQGDLFGERARFQGLEMLDYQDAPVYETTRLTLRVPADLYEAVRLAARAEGKSQNDLIVEILASALSRMPLHAVSDESQREG